MADPSAKQLDGKRVAFLIANEGVEQVELVEPWNAVERAGGTPVLVAPNSGRAQAFNHLDRADTTSTATEGRGTSPGGSSNLEAFAGTRAAAR